jgi:fused signal recognition particle receptor
MRWLVLTELSPTLLGAIAVVVLIAVGLLVAGAVSAKRAANLPAVPKPTKAEVEEEPEVEEPPAPPPPKVKVAPPEPEPNLTPEERAQRKLEDEARKKEAYRLKKQEEAAARDRKKQEEADQAARVAEEAKQKAAAEAQAAAEARAATERKVKAEAGRTLADGLAKTRGGFMSRLNGLFGGAKVEGQLLGELEEVLFSADIGVRTASQLLEVARKNLGRGELSDAQAVKGAIRTEIERIIADANRAPAAHGHSPEVWMIVGVNGVGKTTTIGKLAAQLAGQGKKVVLGAADTFRAAATEQLEVWAKRAGAEIVKGVEGGDPGSVAFEAVKRGREIGADYVLVDTAGRLHTKAPLMEELKKVKRVLAKAEPGAPHEVLLILDSTNGQNAIAQARQFHEALEVTAIALTKLDGTAKGGVVIGICDELKLPLRYVGVGESVGDLRAFEPHEFVEALFA